MKNILIWLGAGACVAVLTLAPAAAQDLVVSGDLLGNGNLSVDGDLRFGTGEAWMDGGSNLISTPDSVDVGESLTVGGETSLGDLTQIFGPLFVDGFTTLAGVKSTSNATVGGNLYFESGDLKALIKNRDSQSVRIESDLSIELQIDSDPENEPIGAELAVFQDSQKILELNESGDLSTRGSQTANAFDLAERFFVTESLRPGELVRAHPEIPGGVIPATSADGQAVLGVVSTRPGFDLGGAMLSREGISRWEPKVRERFNQEFSRVAGQTTGGTSRAAIAGTNRVAIDERRILDLILEQNTVPVALAGRVPIRVDASSTPISIGDPLSAGPIPGVAVKATGPGPIVAIALEALDEGEGTVLGFINRGWTGTGSGSSTLSAHPSPATDRPALREMVADLVDEALAARGTEARSEAVSAGPETTSEVLRVGGHSLADYRPVSEAVRAGDVLVADRNLSGLLEPGTRAADPTVVGVVAGDPGVLTGNRIADIGEAMPELAASLAAARQSGDRETVRAVWNEMRTAFEEVHARVAMSGIVRTRVDADYGAIAVGDLLTVSPTKGHAMRADGPAAGTIVGKALEPLAEGQDRIEILVMLR